MNWLLKRLKSKSDAGDAILVMSTIMVMFIGLCTGLALDLTKSVQVKTELNQAAQDATTYASTRIDKRGSIVESAINCVPTIYISHYTNDNSSPSGACGYTPPADETSSGFSARDGRCDTTGLNTTQEGRTGSATATDVGEVDTNNDGTNDHKAPYMEIRLKTARGDETSGPLYTYEKDHWIIAPGNSTYDPSAIYHVVEAKIWDVSPNFMMGMFGLPCQHLTLSVSSISFGADKDIYDWSVSTPPVDPGGGGGTGGGTGTPNCTTTDGALSVYTASQASVNLSSLITIGMSTDSLKTLAITSNGGTNAALTGTTLKATMAAPGSYTVTYKATTNKGYTCTGKVVINVYNHASCPTAITKAVSTVNGTGWSLFGPYKYNSTFTIKWTPTATLTDTVSVVASTPGTTPASYTMTGAQRTPPLTSTWTGYTSNQLLGGLVTWTYDFKVTDPLGGSVTCP